jgi:hypothetical protein
MEKLLARYRRASGEAKLFWEAYKRAAEYAAPEINSFCKSPGLTKSPDVMTSQALRSTNAFISEFIGSLTPPNRRWAELQPTQELVEWVARKAGFPGEDQIRLQLQVQYDAITKKFFECLDASNFYAVLKQFVLSIGIGTGCLLVSDQDSGPESGNRAPFEFIHVPTSSLSLDAGNNGKIYGVFRDMEVRRAEILELWPDAEPGRLDGRESYKLVECCTYEPDRKPLPWRFCVFEPSTGTKLLQRDRHLPYNPYIVFRWSVVDGESMGRGPLLEAMADIKSLNTLWRIYFDWIQRNGLGVTLVRAAEYATADLDAFRNEEFQTGKLIAVNDPANFVPLRLAGDLSVNTFLVQEFTNAVRQQLLDIELPTQNTMTAYETRERANRILRLMAGLIGRINLEFIEPFFSIGLRLMAEHGMIQIPEQVGGINNFFTKIVLQSPLARSQQMADVDAARVALETLAMAQSPVAAQMINMERFAEFVWTGCGAPAKLLNTPEESQAAQEQDMRQRLVLDQAKRTNLLEEN